jgi:hypothetical protein
VYDSVSELCCVFLYFFFIDLLVVVNINKSNPTANTSSLLATKEIKRIKYYNKKCRRKKEVTL